MKRFSLTERFLSHLFPGDPAPKISKKEQRKLESAFNEIGILLQEWVDEKKFADESIRCCSDIAESLGVNRTTLAQYFVMVLNEDPRTWKVKLMIEMAKELLTKNRDCSLTVVSYSVGFSDRSNFARQFRKHTGMTPGQWRLTHSLPVEEDVDPSETENPGDGVV